MQDLIDRAFEWGAKRGIHNIGTLPTQLTKLMEEVGELAGAVARNDNGKVWDAVGDIIVVLVQFGAIHANERKENESAKLYLRDCLNGALSVIESRTGRLTNGIFIKDNE